MKKGIWLIVLLLVIGAVTIYKTTQPYRISIIDLKAKKEKRLMDEKNKFFLEDKDENLKDSKIHSLASFKDRLEIVGDDRFKEKVKEALRILWTYDRNGSFMMVRKNVFKILQSNRTTFFYHNDVPVIEISNDMYKNSSLTYLASVIAHMGWHAAYLKNKKRRKIDIPHPSESKIDKTPVDIFGKIKRFNDLYKVEEEAFNYQLRVLEKINAPLSEIKRIKNRSYKDFSLAHDGNYFIEF